MGSSGFAKRSGLIDNNAISKKGSKYNVVVEYYYVAVTDYKVETALNEGFPVSIAATNPTGISGEEIKRLIKTGVTEFTVDWHCSMGLNW